MANGPTLPPQAYTREILAVAFQWLQSQPESIKKLAQSPDALVGLYLRAQRYGNSSPENDAPVSSQNFISDLKHLAEGLKQFEGPKPDAKTFSSTVSQSSSQSQSTLLSQLQASLAQSSLAQSGATTKLQASTASQASDSSKSTSVSSTNLGSNGFTQSTQTAETQVSSRSGSAHINFERTPEKGWTAPPQQSPMPPNPYAHVAPQVPPPQPAAAYYAPYAAPPVYAPPAPPVAYDPASNLVGALNPTSQAMIQEVKAALNMSSDAEVLNVLVSIAYKNVKNLLG